MSTEIVKKRNNKIEGLRGISVLIILIFHVFCRFSQIFLNSNIVWMSRFGTFGVAIFLIISGYYFVDFKQVDDAPPGSIVQFIQKRLIKLWPSYALSISITTVLIHIFYLPNRMSTWGDYFLNLIFINGFIGTPYVDGAHWYLTTLISFIVIIACARKFKCDTNPLLYIIWICIQCAATLFKFSLILRFIGGTYVGYISLAISIRYFINNKNKTTSNLIGWILVTVLSAFSIFAHRSIYSIIEIVIIIPIFILCILDKMPFIDNRFLCFIGKISYPMYLIHQNLSFLIEYYLMKCFGYYSIVWGFISILASIGAAYCLYWAVDITTKKYKILFRGVK